MARRWGPTLPGTARLTEDGDLAARMVAGIGAWLDRELAATTAAWSPQLTPDEADARRRDLSRRIGAADPRVPVLALELPATTDGTSLVGRGPGYEVHAVRWPVLPGVDGEGLLLRPAGAPRAHIIALGDADWTPEALAGLEPGVAPEAQFARRLAELACQVVIPVLVDRRTQWAGGRPHREYVWRMGFELGRHILGYEVQRVSALVDFFSGPGSDGARPVGLFGYGEGALVALHAAALDVRVEAAVVSGHFRGRQEVWREPIYRDVWGLLRAGGDDAGLAALVAPRGLLLERSVGPDVAGPASGEEAPHGRSPGCIAPLTAEALWAEADRAARAYGVRGASTLVVTDPGPGLESPPGMPETLVAFLRLLRLRPPAVESLRGPGGVAPERTRPGPDTQARQHRQFRQLCDHIQGLLRASEAERTRWWAGADRSSPEAWARSRAHYSLRFHDEVIGRCPAPDLPPSPRTRVAYDRPGWRGYEVALDLWPDVFAYGVLLVPKGLRAGQRRPVVVCQHGLEGRAQDVIEGPPDSPYRSFGARLADAGYVVYAPQNPYIGGERFRVLQRKAHPLGLSLFSFIIAQHERTLEWLAGLPWVDPARIGFYGLSYGGKTAMRVPALLPGYCLSICSADFNEWVVKCAGEDRRFSYLFTDEYDMYEWDLGHTCNYAEMAGLIAPRPFMVERGHSDGVGVDEWVAYEYAKVRRLYSQLGIPERTEIEFFEGGHRIWGQGTLSFLARHLGEPGGGG